jgi:hypothetical protein
MCGTAILLILLEDRPYGIQLSSIVGYTAAVALYTSAATAITCNRSCFLAPLSVASFPCLSADIWVFLLPSSYFRQQPSNFAQTCPRT